MEESDFEVDFELDEDWDDVLGGDSDEEVGGSENSDKGKSGDEEKESASKGKVEAVRYVHEDEEEVKREVSKLDSKYNDLKDVEEGQLSAEEMAATLAVHARLQEMEAGELLPDEEYEERNRAKSRGEEFGETHCVGQEIETIVCVLSPEHIVCR